MHPSHAPLPDMKSKPSRDIDRGGSRETEGERENAPLPCPAPSRPPQHRLQGVPDGSLESLRHQTAVQRLRSTSTLPVHPEAGLTPPYFRSGRSAFRGGANVAHIRQPTPDSGLARTTFGEKVPNLGYSLSLGGAPPLRFVSAGIPAVCWRPCTTRERRVHTYVYIYIFIYIYIYPSVYLYIYLYVSIYLSIDLSIYPSVNIYI